MKVNGGASWKDDIFTKTSLIEDKHKWSQDGDCWTHKCEYLAATNSMTPYEDFVQGVYNYFLKQGVQFSAPFNWGLNSEFFENAV